MMFNKKKDIDSDFVAENARKTDKKDLDHIVGNEEKVEAKIARSGMLEKYSELGKLMLDMLKDYKNGVYRKVPWFTIGSIVFALIYVLNPFDIVPDFIPGLGYIDDLSVFTIALRFVETDLHNYLDWKLGNA
jgi:uncharacterized membrane protein YkvA (DUF1232 family)